MSAITGPIAPYSNPPINPQYYEPSRFEVTDIVLGMTTTVTTAVDHNYVIGQQCRILVPESFGCSQLNGLTGYVIQIPAADEVVLNIYSVGGNPYMSSSATTTPQIMAIGDILQGAVNANGRKNNGTYVPGSFINISPL